MHVFIDQVVDWTDNVYKDYLNLSDDIELKQQLALSMSPTLKIKPSTEEPAPNKEE